MNTVTLDRYEMFSLLGRGAIGVVYKARDLKLKRVVAIKILRQVFLEDRRGGKEARARFERECFAAGSLFHPNIVTILDSGYTDIGLPYIVMEYIPGTNLQELIDNGQKLDTAISLHYLRQLASAVDYAHEHGVIHRDLKPSNVVIDKFDHPHLLDFSTAKFSKTAITLSGEFVGTLGYAAPEQLKGGKIDHRTDLYSFAVLAYVMLTGRMPFNCDSLMSALHVASDTTIPLSVAPELSPDNSQTNKIQTSDITKIDSIFKKALSQDPQTRYQSAGIFVNDLRQALGLSIHDTKLIGEFVNRSTCRTGNMLPHKYGRERSNSFGRTGKTAAGFYKQYLASQVANNNHNVAHSDTTRNNAVCSDALDKKNKSLNITNNRITQSRSCPLPAWLLDQITHTSTTDRAIDSVTPDRMWYSKYSLQLILFVAISGTMHPFLSSLVGEGNYAVATTQRSFADLFQIIEGNDNNRDIAISQLPSHAPYTPARMLSEITSIPVEDRSFSMEENILNIAATTTGEIQVAAIEMLANTTQIDKHRVTELLIDLLSHSDRSVRANASRSLAIVAGKSSIGLLSNQAEHETDPFVKRVITYSIQKYAGSPIS